MNPSLIHPFTCLVAGPTQSGKTFFVSKLTQCASSLIQPPPEKILWCYSEWQQAYENLRNVEFLEGLPQMESLDGSQTTLLIIDDCMGNFDEKLADLFTKKSHHKDLSVIHIVQNLFHKSKNHRTVSLNTHYLILFKNPRDVTQVRHLANQMYPSNTGLMQEAFRDATSQAHGYLLVDLKQQTPDHLRLRTHIFPGERQVVYVPKV